MELIKIHVIGLKPFQTDVYGRHGIFAGPPAFSGNVARVQPELGGDPHFVAAFFQGFADIFLRTTVSVPFRRIEKRDSSVQRCLDHRYGLFFALAPTKGIAPQPHNCDVKPLLASDTSCVHGPYPWCFRWVC